MKLLASETDLVGNWRLVGKSIESDETCRRIDWLTKEVLTWVGSDPSGWDTLYLDPGDGRYWERTYLHRASHGGGPPRLSNIKTSDAQRRYGVACR
jgi:hypothetical protein